MTKSKDEFRVVTDIAMYISLIITLYAFIPTFKNLLQFGFTRHLTKVFIFDLLLLTSQILAMTYRYASNIDAIRLLIAALYIINIMSLIFQLYVSEMFVLLAFAGYFNQRPIILYILVLIAFISTGSSMFFITVGFTNSFSQNIIDWFTIGYALWIGMTMMINNVSLIYVTYRLYKTSITLHWYNERYIRESSGMFYQALLYLSIPFLVDISSCLCFIFGLYSQMNSKSISLVGFNLFRLWFYSRPFIYVSTFTYFNKLIEMGYGEIHHLAAGDLSSSHTVKPDIV
ncbi:hypothetical protein BC833DRAFT_593915 [Globomyces pollinis-pini]|nr:hypothetical protein BC833DRAFT_593915 [Globomyces pollinis-pini]